MVQGKIVRFAPSSSDNDSNNSEHSKEAHKDKKSAKAEDTSTLAVITGSWQGLIEYSKTGQKVSMMNHVN